MALLEGLCRRARAPDIARRLESAPSAAIQAAELGFSVAHELGVVDVAGGREHHARWRRSWPGGSARRSCGVEALDALGGAEDGAADRLLGEGRVLQQLVGDLVGAVAGGGDLLQDHLALALELVLGVARDLQDVGQDVEREADVGLERAREVGGGLQAGGGIELAADRLDLLGDVAGAAPLGALEGHVLEQMRDAVLGLALVARAGAPPRRPATPSPRAACGGRRRAGRWRAG